VALTPLPGGISSLVSRLDIETPDGAAWSFVVRRSDPDPDDHAHVTPERLAYEWRVLKVIRAAGIPAPEPVLLDIEGRFIETPGIVLTYIPGAPVFPGEDVVKWSKEMAAAACHVHRVTPESTDLSPLNVRMRDQMRERLQMLRPVAAGDALGARVHEALVAGLDRTEMTPSLTHGDFWTGNTVWENGRITGIVDWPGASVADPRRDVADCRAELVMSHGAAAADEFLAAYEAASGRRLDIAYFDLYRGLEPYLETDHWIEGALDLGQQVDERAAHERMRAFLERTLAAQ
jgi:aminoglycoside phosphotransferase (APT) family kinase protein